LSQTTESCVMSDADDPEGIFKSGWGLAAVVVVAIHAGCVAVALRIMAPDDVEVVTGAMAIEIGVEWTSPPIERIDLPPGPEADASAASPAVVEQKAVVEQTDLPKAVPTETDDPDRLVTPADVKKPNDDDPKMTTAQAIPSVESVESEATTAPSAESAAEGPRSLSPATGPGESMRRERLTWQRELAAHLGKHKRYPNDRASQSVEIVLGFALYRTGRVLSVAVVRGSGDRSFDDAALAMMRRADPVPPPPPRIADSGLSFTLPIIFRAKAAN
jgi:periplasmic protein TonB